MRQLVRSIAGVTLWNRQNDVLTGSWQTRWSQEIRKRESNRSRRWRDNASARRS